MDTERIEVMKHFANYIEYPMAVFEAETGRVLVLNYGAEVLFGGRVETIQMEPGRTFTKNNFWDALHGKKSLVWPRIRLTADGKEVTVSGLVNEILEGDTLIYAVLGDRRANLNIGSLTLERIVERAGIVAVHMTKAEDGFQVDYVSKNLNQYGYTREQIYDRTLIISEIICAEDHDRFLSIVNEAIAGRSGMNTVECRIFTESRDLIPVRLLFQYVYDEQGELTDIEILVFDLRDEYCKNQENTYLSNAVTKMKSVVMVKSYRAGERVLQYISPNAGMIGMNVEALQKGYKLTEDYIHPEDRDSVMDSIYQAVAHEITDYVQVYRMVRDDGRQIWVENEVTVNRISDGEAEISFLITDITERKNIEKEMAAVLEPEEMMAEPAIGPSVDMLTIDSNDEEMLAAFQMMADAMSKNANYYSILLDADGKQLTAPAGPASDMGRFYDIFERPQLKEEFENVSERAKEQHIPHSVEFDVDGLRVHMILAPLTLGEKVAAYWVLTSFAPDGAELLSEVVEDQWKLADSIVQYFCLQDSIRKETKVRKLTEMQLHKEQMEHRAIEDVIASMSRSGKTGLSEMCSKAGIYLSIEKIALYLKNRESGMVEKYFLWDCSGEDSMFYDRMVMSQSEYDVLVEQFKEELLLTANNQTEQPFLREMARKVNMSLMVYKLSVLSDLEGYVVFADKDRNREYDHIEKHFVATISKVLESTIASQQKRVMPDVVQTGLLESYDHVRDAVYVKDNKTGEIIFANKAMDKLFGYSVVGMRSMDIISDTMERYQNIGGVHKRFIANKKVTKWQTYVKELDQIMNIVEVHMETLYGADWNLFILKKNKDKKKGKES